MLVPTLAQIYPELPNEALDEALRPYGLNAFASVVDLFSLGGAAAIVVETIASWVVDHRQDRHLHHIAPALARDGEQALTADALTTRSANGIRSAGLQTWNALAQYSAVDLLRLPSLGQKSVCEIVGYALYRAATQELLDASRPTRVDDMGVTKVPDDPTRPPWTHDVAPPAGLDVLARWASCVGVGSTIGESLDLASSRPLPAEVSRSLEAFRQTPLNTLGPHHSVDQAFEKLWSNCPDKRQRMVLIRRVAFDAPTLDELGTELGLTRERIRQIQKAAADNVVAALEQDECSEIRWLVSDLRDALGTAIRFDSEEAQQTISTALRGLPADDRQTAVGVLLWLAGPYRLDRQTGWIYTEREYLRAQVGPRSDIGPPPSRSLLAEIIDEHYVVDRERARQRAQAAGLAPGAIDEWLATCPFRQLNGSTVLWHGTVLDKAEVVLLARGSPATAEELNVVIGEGHSPRGLRNRLLDDERFVRTDKSRIGLRRWGLEEYSGIVDEIEQEIERRGGNADVADLVAALSQQFQLRSASVVSYTGVPRFVVEGRRIRLRRVDEPYAPARPLWDEVGAFQLDDERCSYRWRVDADVLRGSGRPLPQGVGAWLGVLPGARRQFHFPNGDTVLLSWPDSALFGPAIGSLRTQALTLEAITGDLIRLVFNRVTDEVSATIIRASDLDNVEGWRRGLLLTGIEAADEREFEQSLALALNVTSRGDIRRRLRERGEQDLADLVPREHASELDDALERLKEII